MKKLLALLLALVMVLGVLAGCNKTPADTTPSDTKPAADNTKPTDTKPEEKPLSQIWSEAKDVTEIPDWEGDTLTMVCWWQAYSPNGGGLSKQESTDKIVLKEIKRITGCEFSYEESFMNDEKSVDDMIAKMVATNYFPDVIDQGAEISLNELAANGYLWDVSELMPKYAPTYWKLNGPENPLYAAHYQKQIDTYGGIFIFANDNNAGKTVYQLGTYFPDQYPEYVNFFTEQEVTNGGYARKAQADRRYVYVRQDILDQLFPGCNSNASWRAIVEERPLEPADYLDIPLDSLADFEKMLYDIKAILDKEGDPSVYTFYTHNGTDNWSFFIQHRQIWGTNSDYVGYYDIDKGTIVKALEQDWYKEIVAMANKWIRDGICSPEAVIDSHDQCKEKIANSKYAVVQWDFGPTYCGNPDPDAYRRVYMRWDCSDVAKDNCLHTESIYPTYLPRASALCKGGNLDTEEKVAQFLMSLEFLTTRAAKLLATYGTPDLGFYEENEDGTISITGELKGMIASGSPAATSQKFYRKHGFGSWGSVNYGWPGYLPVGAFQDNAYIRDNYKDIAPATVSFPSLEAEFPAEYTQIEGLTLKIGLNACLSGYFLNDVEGFKNFWAARTQWEEMMTKAMVAPSEAEFETAYQALLDFIVEMGWDDATTQEMNKMLLETQGLAEQLKAAGLPVPEGY